MNFVRFIFLLETSKLWFSRADLLDDPREGGLTKLELEQLRNSASPETGEHNLRVFETLRRENFINSWTENGESMAMWELYAGSPGGVAIKSTIRKLKSAISSACERIHIGRVDYID